MAGALCCMGTNMSPSGYTFEGWLWVAPCITAACLHESLLDSRCIAIAPDPGSAASTQRIRSDRSMPPPPPPPPPPRHRS
eukprot:COSAG01_NODE_74_length_28433_cov_41.582269_9_plen_80_part_00